MKLPKMMQHELVQRCETAVCSHADALPADSFLGAAHQQGNLREVLAGLLTPFAAEVGIGEGTQLMSMAKQYKTAQPEQRQQLEQKFREVILSVAARIPGATAQWERALDSVHVLVRSFG